LVDRVLDRSDRLEAQLGAVRGERPRLPAIAAVAVALAVALAGTGERPLGAAERDRQRRRGAAEDGAARQRGGGDVAEGRVVAVIARAEGALAGALDRKSVV